MLRVRRLVIECNQYYAELRHEGKLSSIGYMESAQFTDYFILEKHFREDFRDAFLRWTDKDGKKPFSKKENKRFDKQFQETLDALEKAVELNYINVFPPKSDIVGKDVSIKPTKEGREFIRPWKFLNTVAGEYRDLIAVLGTLGIGTLIGYIARSFIH